MGQSVSVILESTQSVVIPLQQVDAYIRWYNERRIKLSRVPSTPKCTANMRAGIIKQSGNRPHLQTANNLGVDTYPECFKNLRSQRLLDYIYCFKTGIILPLLRTSNHARGSHHKMMKTLAVHCILNLTDKLIVAHCVPGRVIIV